MSAHTPLLFLVKCSVTLTIRKLEQEILDAGHHVCILTTKSGNLKHGDLVPTHPNRTLLYMDNALVIPFLGDPESEDVGYQIGLELSRTIQKKMLDFEPTIIHITVPDLTSTHVILYARKNEIPLMGTYHSNIPEYMIHYEGMSWAKHFISSHMCQQYNFFQALYVPTPYIATKLRDSYGLDACTDVRIWGRGVDTEVFNPCYRSLEFRRSLGIADDTCVILWVGRFVPEKRFDIFISVIRRLNEIKANFHALVVGAGQMEKEIDGLLNTTCAGWLSGESLSVAYASSDIFLFPSSVETFGNVTLEAAASGLPVVVEALCSGHLVIEAENGFKVQEGSHDIFFEKTLALVVDQKKRRSFGDRSRELSLSLEKAVVVRQMIDHYDQVTNEFFGTYGGHHANRDEVYTQPGSFLFGRHPRLFVLSIVEFIIFQVGWNIVLSSFWIVDCFKTSSLHKDPKVRRSEIKKADNIIDRTPSTAFTSPRKKNIETEMKTPRKGCGQQTGASSNNKSTSVLRILDADFFHRAARFFIRCIQIYCRCESGMRHFFDRESYKYETLNGRLSKRKNSNVVLVNELHPIKEFFSLKDVNKPDQVPAEIDTKSFYDKRISRRSNA